MNSKVLEAIKVEGIMTLLRKIPIYVTYFLQSIDQLFQYLSTNLRTLRERLFDSMYPHITAQLWKTISNLMEEQVFVGVRI